jgi:hypothetical protein
MYVYCITEMGLLGKYIASKCSFFSVYYYTLYTVKLKKKTDED